MILIVSSWFNEVGYYFNISHKVSNLIREELKKDIMNKFGLIEKESEWFLKLNVTTNSNIKEMEVPYLNT